MQNKHFIWGISGLVFGIALGVLIANAGLVAKAPSSPEGSGGTVFVNPDIAANPALAIRTPNAIPKIRPDTPQIKCLFCIKIY